MAPLPPTAQYARAILSIAFGWVFLRGWQLRHGLLSRPEDLEMAKFNLLTGTLAESSSSNRQLRAPIKIATNDNHEERKMGQHSACLFMTQQQEENFHLGEWLANNAFVLPMNYLVLSKASTDQLISSEMLLAYQKDLGITIVEWTVVDFVSDPDTMVAQAPKDEEQESMDGQEAQITRQHLFMEKCAIFMQQEHGQDMVTFHDTDKFVKSNHK